MVKRKGDMMPLCLSRFSYTPETWARLIVHPEDRAKAAQAYIESVGGKLHGFWWLRLRWRLASGFHEWACAGVDQTGGEGF